MCQVLKVLEDWDDQGGFVEVQTRTHKTAKSASNKAVLLPIVILPQASLEMLGFVKPRLLLLKSDCSMLETYKAHFQSMVSCRTA